MTVTVQCPFCFETFSILLYREDGETQELVYDCEVCCHPIELIATWNEQTVEKLRSSDLALIGLSMGFWRLIFQKWRRSTGMEVTKRNRRRARPPFGSSDRIRPGSIAHAPRKERPAFPRFAERPRALGENFPADVRSG